MNSLNLALRQLLICFGLALTGCGGTSGDSINEKTYEPPPPVELNRKTFFDWNQQSDQFICDKGLQRYQQLTLGTQFDPLDKVQNTIAMNQLKAILRNEFSESMVFVAGTEESKLATLVVEVKNCKALGRLRALAEVEFISPTYAIPLMPEDLFHLKLGFDLPTLSTEETTRVNPAHYDQAYGAYADFIASDIRFSNTITPEVIEYHNLEPIYSYNDGYMGDSKIGVGIIDNGLLLEDAKYLGAGGLLSQQGFHSSEKGGLDGSTPLEQDLYGLGHLTNFVKTHGSQQATNVYKVAPGTSIYTLRASPFVIWYEPRQFEAVTQAILSAADNPKIKILSNSQATIVHIHKIERAIEYFNARDKIFISAGGTTPYALFSRIIKNIFPANLESTLNATGVVFNENGFLEQGPEAWAGKLVDFVVAPATTSSPAVSHLAGMIALIWSANPTLSRDQIIQITKESSGYYHENGFRHPQFGWGILDAGAAFHKALSTP